MFRFWPSSNVRFRAAALADRVIKLLRSTYADFGPTLATEEAQNQAWHRFGQRDRATASDRGRIVDPAEAQATEDSTAAYEAGVHSGADPGGDGHTQFGRALFELNIDGICANTPAAKGRVERTPSCRPDGKIGIRAAGVKVPYSRYDKLGAIDQGAIVENKRLGHALRISSYHLLDALLTRLRSIDYRRY